MEKIDLLLEQLDNRIPQSMANRLDKLDELQEKLELAGKEYEENPTDENKEKYNGIIDFVEEKELGIIEDLEKLLQSRKSQQTQSQNTPPANNSPANNPPASEEKKEGIGVVGLVAGVVILVASLGAINYFRKQ